MFATILKTLLTKLVTEKVIIKVFVMLAEHLAAKTNTKIDDQMVATIKEALEA